MKSLARRRRRVQEGALVELPPTPHAQMIFKPERIILPRAFEPEHELFTYSLDTSPEAIHIDPAAESVVIDIPPDATSITLDLRPRHPIEPAREVKVNLYRHPEGKP